LTRRGTRRVFTSQRLLFVSPRGAKIRYRGAARKGKGQSIWSEGDKGRTSMRLSKTVAIVVCICASMLVMLCFYQAFHA
jgi:hypothetical protein